MPKRKPKQTGPAKSAPKTPTESAPLNPKQEQFCQEYLVDLNGTQAAIRAGYSDKTANEQSSQLLAKLHIQARVAELQAARGQRLEVTQDQVLREFAKLAFANMQDFITVQPDGTAYVDLSKLTREQAAALQEVVVDEYTDGRGKTAREVKRIRIKLADKKSALDSVAKHLGMFVERLQVDLTAGALEQAIARGRKRAGKA